MIALLAIHLGTNYLAVRAVSMRTLNRQRANLLFSRCFDGLPDPHLLMEDSPLPELSVLSPDEISLQERIFERDGVLRWNGGEVLGFCRLGVDLRAVLTVLGRPDKKTGSYRESASTGITKVMELYQEEQYLLWYDVSSKTFLIVLKDRSDTVTHLKAWMHALYSAKQRRIPLDQEALIQFLRGTLRDVTDFIKHTELFQKLERAGWDVNNGAMETRSGTRVQLIGRNK